MTTLQEAAMRKDFEAHWLKVRGAKNAKRELVRREDQPQAYVQDSANRHWVTWQAAMAQQGELRAWITQAGTVTGKFAPDGTPHDGKLYGWEPLYTAAPAPQPLAQQGEQHPVAWYEYNQDLDAWFLAYGHNPKAKTRPLVFGDTAAPAPVAQQCTYCDGTGDVHSIDGEWRGSCPCAAAPAPVAQPVVWVWNPANLTWEKVRAFGHWQQGALYAFGPTQPETLAAPAQHPARECTRSHPHELMDGYCELRTEIARLTNENARLKAAPQPAQAMKAEFEKLLGEYWDIAHTEGETGLSQSNEANEVLCKLRALLQSAQPVAPHECKTEAEKLAYAAGWWKALESVHVADQGIKEGK